MNVKIHSRLLLRRETALDVQQHRVQNTPKMADDEVKDGVACVDENAIVAEGEQRDDYVVEEGVEEEGETNAKKENNGFMEAARSEALRPFVIISSSYLLFTITDGAIRMIVLQHAYSKSFSAMQVAIMFTLYEVAGVFTNLVRSIILTLYAVVESGSSHPTIFFLRHHVQAAGFMGAKWGIKFTLIIGLSLQLFSYSLMFGWRDDWSQAQAIVYVTVSQMFAGIAKDLTKLGGKTVTKLVTPEEQETKLYKLVSLITGWKNSLKGVGYFMGSALVQVSYELALGVMMGLVVLAMPWAILGLDRNLGTAKNQNASWKEVFKMDNPKLNWLSCARLFLFASRDFWFEVPLPFFLRSPSCEGLGELVCGPDFECATGSVCGAAGFCENINPGGGCGGLGLERVVVGAFLGGYIILYGQVQAWTPQLVTGPLKQTPPNKLTEVLWGFVNCLPTLVIWIVMSWSPTFEDHDVTGMTVWLVVVIVSFAIIFAINSSIHSFLVVNYASKDKVAVSVGFYYMSNALGRLFGTLGSGVLYTYVGDNFGAFLGHDAIAGLAACFLAGTLSSLVAAVITLKIDDHKSGLKCGSCLTIVPENTTIDDEEDSAEKDQLADENGKARKYSDGRPMFD
jgi:hypothetical protein